MFKKEPQNDAQRKQEQQNTATTLCPICKPKGLRSCKCLPKAGGDSDSDNSTEVKKTPTDDTTASAATERARTLTPTLLPPVSQVRLELGIRTRSSAPEKILELASIQYDPQRGILTVRPKPGLNKEQLALVEQLGKTLEYEYDQYKTELEVKRIPTQGFTKHYDQNTHTLTMRIPSQEHFDALMHRFATPLDQAKRQELLAGNALSMRPAPSGKPALEQIETRRTAPTPLRTTPTPLPTTK